MSGGSGFLAGLLVGAAVGVTVGLLLSPQTGQDNRTALANQLPVLKERAPEVAARAPSFFDRIRAELKARFSDGRQAYVQGAEETRGRLIRELDAQQEGRPIPA